MDEDDDEHDEDSMVVEALMNVLDALLVVVLEVVAVEYLD